MKKLLAVFLVGVFFLVGCNRAVTAVPTELIEVSPTPTPIPAVWEIARQMVEDTSSPLISPEEVPEQQLTQEGRWVKNFFAELRSSGIDAQFWLSPLQELPDAAFKIVYAQDHKGATLVVSQTSLCSGRCSRYLLFIDPGSTPGTQRFPEMLKVGKYLVSVTVGYRNPQGRGSTNVSSLMSSSLEKPYLTEAELQQLKLAYACATYQIVEPGAVSLAGAWPVSREVAEFMEGYGFITPWNAEGVSCSP